jgi:hypothetical protein
MKGITIKLFLYLLISLITLNSAGNAQEGSAKKEIPSNVPADVRHTIMILGSADAIERANAACSLGKMGNVAVVAIPSLIELFSDTTAIRSISCWAGHEWNPKGEDAKDSSPGKEAAKSVAAMGQYALAPLIAALSDERWAVRSNAAWALGEMREGHKTNRTSAIDPLIATLNDVRSEVRATAAEALGEIAHPRAVDALIGALADPDWQVRWKASWALAELKDKKAVEMLIITLNDNSAEVRVAVADALGEIKDSRAVTALKASLKDESSAVRERARKALNEIRGN